jgi:predicted acyltransferase
MNKPERSLALDVFRGMTVAFMILVNTPGSWIHVYAPLSHAKWHGYTPTDLVFPFFLLAVGMAMSYSARKFEHAGDADYFRKVIWRSSIIFLIGVSLEAFPFFNTDWEQLRIMGVLQRIALAFFAASVAVRYLKDSFIPLVSILILAAYWILLLAFGGPDAHGPEGNAVLKLDRLVMGDRHLWDGLGYPFDPEGLLSTLPATVNVLAGYYLGRQVQQTAGRGIVLKLTLTGLALLLAGHLWNPVHPINKSLWTGSYVLVSTGFGSLGLAALVYLIDLKGLRSWIKPFLVFGMNPLFIYVFSILWVLVYYQVSIQGQNLHGWLYDNFFRSMVTPEFGSLVFALVHVAGCWLVGLALFRRRIFIRV